MLPYAYEETLFTDKKNPPIAKQIQRRQIPVKFSIRNLTSKWRVCEMSKEREDRFISRISLYILVTGVNQLHFTIFTGFPKFKKGVVLHRIEIWRGLQHLWVEQHIFSVRLPCDSKTKMHFRTFWATSMILNVDMDNFGEKFTRWKTLLTSWSKVRARKKLLHLQNFQTKLYFRRF